MIQSFKLLPKVRFKCGPVTDVRANFVLEIPQLFNKDLLKIAL